MGGRASHNRDNIRLPACEFFHIPLSSWANQLGSVRRTFPHGWEANCTDPIGLAKPNQAQLHRPNGLGQSVQTQLVLVEPNPAQLYRPLAARLHKPFCNLLTWAAQLFPPKWTKPTALLGGWACALCTGWGTLVARDAVPPAPSPLLHGSLGGPKARQATGWVGWTTKWSGPALRPQKPAQPNLGTRHKKRAEAQRAPALPFRSSECKRATAYGHGKPVS